MNIHLFTRPLYDSHWGIMNYIYSDVIMYIAPVALLYCKKYFTDYVFKWGKLFIYSKNSSLYIDRIGLEYIDFKIVLVPTGGKCGTICVKDLNSSILTPKVLVEKWIMPSWWEIATPPINTKERIWRGITDEEKYIYISEENGQYTVERNSDVLFARAVARKFEDYKVKEQVVVGNIIVSLSPAPSLPVG